MSELHANGVRVYKFPIDDESVAEANASMNVSVWFNPTLAVHILWFNPTFSSAHFMI